MAAPQVLIPEVYEPDEVLPADLLALRKFAQLMDEALPIPGTRRRFGLDAALGLVPGLGDVVAALLSSWIIIGALRWRVPFVHVVRMVFNVLLDLFLGAVPLIGDVFDFVFEENVINLRLLLRYRDRTQPPRSPGEVAGAATIVILIILGFAFLLLAALLSGVLWLVAHR
jgi:hypothetical protein